MYERDALVDTHRWTRSSASVFPASRYFVVKDHDQVFSLVVTVTAYFVARTSGFFGNKQTLEALSARAAFAGDFGVETQHSTSPPLDDFSTAVAAPSPYQESVIG